MSDFPIKLEHRGRIIWPEPFDVLVTIAWQRLADHCYGGSTRCAALDIAERIFAQRLEVGQRCRGPQLVADPDMNDTRELWPMSEPERGLLELMERIREDMMADGLNPEDHIESHLRFMQAMAQRVETFETGLCEPVFDFRQWNQQYPLAAFPSVAPCPEQTDEPPQIDQDEPPQIDQDEPPQTNQVEPAQTDQAEPGLSRDPRPEGVLADLFIEYAVTRLNKPLNLLKSESAKIRDDLQLLLREALKNGAIPKDWGNTLPGPKTMRDHVEQYVVKKKRAPGR